MKSRRFCAVLCLHGMDHDKVALGCYPASILARCGEKWRGSVNLVGFAAVFGDL